MKKNLIKPPIKQMMKINSETKLGFAIACTNAGVALPTPELEDMNIRSAQRMYEQNKQRINIVWEKEKIPWFTYPDDILTQ